MNPQIFGAGVSARSRALTAQQRINVYADIATAAEQDRAQVSFFGRPGLRRVGAFGATPVRAMHAIPPLLYLVIGNTLYQMDNAFRLTAITGTLATSSGQVTMADNAAQLFVADSLGNGYLLQIYGASAATGQVRSDGLVRITDPAFLGSTWVTYLNNFFIVGVPGSNPFTAQTFQISNVGDGTGWDALLFDLADADPDPLVLGYGYQGILYLLGTQSTERWQDGGQGQQPFVRLPATVQGYGLAAPQSVVDFGDAGLALLAQSRNGNAIPAILTPQGFLPIGTPDLDYLINQYPIFSDAVGATYQVAGHRFYQLSFPNAGATWVYDVSSQFWQQFKSYAGGAQGQFRGQFAALFNGNTLISDYANGNLYALDATQFTDADQPLVRQMVSRHLFEGDRRQYLNAVQFDMQPGVGTAACPNPVALLEVSRDKGNTWSQPVTAPLGAQGNFRTRTVFRRLGMARDATLRLTVSDPVPFVLTGEALELEEALGNRWPE